MAAAVAKDLPLRLRLVSEARPFSDGLVERFGAWLRSAPDDALYRVSVVRWARAEGADETETLDLFLHATKAGILSIGWGVICELCGLLIQSPGGLRALKRNTICEL
jgi:hypothetical protein